MTLAERLVRLCLPWLPPHLRDWGEAMARETGEVPGGLRAILFAAGCVVFAARVGIGGRMRAGLRAVMPVKAYGDRIPITALCEPRGFTLACAFTATTLGLVQLGASGAAHGMLVMNAMAFVAGLIMVFPLAKRETADHPFFGLLSLGTGAALLFTAAFGEQVSGASRWILIGQIARQPSLIMLPLIIVGFARTRDSLTAFGIVMAAMALALQPDRAMAGALLAGLSAVAIFARHPRILFCVGAAGLAFAITWFRPDVVPAAPHVDRLFRAAFSNGVVPGLSVWVGAIVLMLPAGFGILRDRAHCAVHAAFGATWLAVLTAAAWGDFPAPLVGYGGSAIVGYILATLALPRRWTTSRSAVEAVVIDQDKGNARRCDLSPTQGLRTNLNL